MKRLFIIFGILICFIARADTEIINWYVDGNSYATTTCQTGDDIILPTIPTKYGYTFQGWARYIPLEYIESTGTQWIDTGIIVNHSTEAEIEFADKKDSNPLFLVSTGSWYSKNFGIIINDYIRFYMNCDGLTTYARVSGVSISGNIKLLLTGIFLNDKRLSLSMGSIPSSSAFTTTYSIPIFLMNDNGAPRYFSAYKLKYFKLWQDDTLVRDMIPVLDYNGIPCMYDKISQQFFYNQGTGNFIAGPVIGGQ